MDGIGVNLPVFGGIKHLTQRGVPLKENIFQMLIDFDSTRPASFHGVIRLKLRVHINSTSKSLLCLLRVWEIITNGNNKAIAAGAWHCFLWCRPLVVGPIQYFTLQRIAHCAVIRKRHLGALCVITLEAASRAVAGKRPYRVGSTCWQLATRKISWTLFWLPTNLSSWDCCWRVICCFKNQERCEVRRVTNASCSWYHQQTSEWNLRLIFWGRDKVPVGNDVKDAIAVASASPSLLFNHQTAPTGTVWLPGREVTFCVFCRVIHYFHIHHSSVKWPIPSIFDHVWLPGRQVTFWVIHSFHLQSNDPFHPYLIMSGFF